MELIELFQKKEIPYIVVYNKMDLLSEKKELSWEEIYVSALEKEGIYRIKRKDWKICSYRRYENAAGGRSYPAVRSGSAGGAY